MKLNMLMLNVLLQKNNNNKHINCLIRQRTNNLALRKGDRWETQGISYGVIRLCMPMAYDNLNPGLVPSLHSIDIQWLTNSRAAQRTYIDGWQRKGAMSTFWRNWEILIPGESPSMFLFLDNTWNFNSLQKRRKMTLLKQFIKLEWVRKGVMSTQMF